MRAFNIPFYFMTIILSGVMLGSCDDCENPINEVVGDEYFTLTFAGGLPADFLMYLDPTGGENPTPQLERIQPPVENGKLGPIFFTERFIDPISNEVNGVGLENTRLAYNYHVRRGTGIEDDILRVEFFLEAGSCETTWKYIRYFLNAELLEEFTDVQQVDIRVP
ncbi:MAG: hypothetical protein AAF694_05865 [Bacteroidota bacterium]